MSYASLLLLAFDHDTPPSGVQEQLARNTFLAVIGYAWAIRQSAWPAERTLPPGVLLDFCAYWLTAGLLVSGKAAKRAGKKMALKVRHALRAGCGAEHAGWSAQRSPRAAASPEPAAAPAAPQERPIDGARKLLKGYSVRRKEPAAFLRELAGCGVAAVHLTMRLVRGGPKASIFRQRVAALAQSVDGFAQQRQETEAEIREWLH